MKRILVASALTFFGAILPAHANVLKASYGSDMQLRGAVDYRWLGFPLYSASLFTPMGGKFDWRKPAALQLEYDREISRQNLIKATMVELSRMEGKQADHDAISGKLVACFRDVKDGDHFVASSQSANAVSLYFNGSKTCTLQHSNIRERFLGIWLSDNSRSPKLSRRLRGE